MRNGWKVIISKPYDLNVVLLQPTTLGLIQCSFVAMPVIAVYLYSDAQFRNQNIYLVPLDLRAPCRRRKD
jgi:hypothetical protein